MRALHVIILAGSVLVSSCADPALPDGPYLEATIEGAFEFRHLAGAEGGGGTRSESNRMYTVSSSMQEENSHFQIQLLRSEADGFRDGSYTLKARSFHRGDNDGETIRVTYQSNVYLAESGTLDITRVEDGWVTGTFDFVGVFVCVTPRDGQACVDIPETFPADAPRIQVRGSFDAEPSRPVPRAGG